MILLPMVAAMLMMHLVIQAHAKTVKEHLNLLTNIKVMSLERYFIWQLDTIMVMVLTEQSSL